ncbi:hypothetical protein FB99_42800 (plasmid) [Pantoea agglomerans]|nr:hypothetical protein FB99_42800 [Pantoea agglomerans]
MKHHLPYSDVVQISMTGPACEVQAKRISRLDTLISHAV